MTREIRKNELIKRERREKDAGKRRSERKSEGKRGEMTSVGGKIRRKKWVVRKKGKQICR